MVTNLILMLCCISTSFGSGSPSELVSQIHSHSTGAFMETHYRQPNVEPVSTSSTTATSFSTAMKTANVQLVDDISPICVAHRHSADFVDNSSPIILTKRDKNAPDSYNLFFDALPSFNVIEWPSTLLLMEEADKKDTYSFYTKFIKPTFGTLIVSEDFFKAMNIKPRLTEKDQNECVIHFLRDVLTLKTPLSMKDYMYRSPGSIVLSPFSFRAIRVVPVSICPTASIILPKGFEHLIGERFSLSMKNSDEEFFQAINKIPVQFGSPSFYLGGGFSGKSPLSKILDTYVPLIEIGAISTANWYSYFNKLYTKIAECNSNGKVILRWLLDRIFGESLRNIQPALNHPFLKSDRYTAKDLFDLFTLATKFRDFIPISTEAEKMVGRNVNLVKAWLAGGRIPSHRPDLTDISRWQFQQQIFFATYCKLTFEGDENFMIDWIKNTMRSLNSLRCNHRGRYEDIYNALDLLELLLNNLNDDFPSDCFHPYLLDLMKEQVLSTSDSTISDIIFRVFKEKSIFLLPRELSLDFYLMRKYYYGEKKMVSLYCDDEKVHRISENDTPLNSAGLLYRAFPHIIGQSHFLRGSLYHIVSALGLKDTTKITTCNESFYKDFSKVHCMIMHNEYSAIVPFLASLRNRYTHYHEGPYNFLGEDLLSLTKEDGIAVLSERFLYSIFRQSWSRSEEGTASFGILFQTAKQLCSGDIESWRHSLRLMVDLFNQFISAQTNMVCLSQIMRECYIFNVDCSFPALEKMYTYRYMKKRMAEMDLWSAEQTAAFTISDEVVEIEIDLKDWAKIKEDDGCKIYDFDLYTSEHLHFFTSVAHLIFGIPVGFLRISTDEDNTLFELSSYLEYSLIEYAESLTGQRNSIKQQFKVRIIDPNMEDYELFIRNEERKEKERKLMAENDVALPFEIRLSRDANGLNYYIENGVKYIESVHGFYYVSSNRSKTFKTFASCSDIQCSLCDINDDNQYVDDNGCLCRLVRVDDSKKYYLNEKGEFYCSGRKSFYFDDETGMYFYREESSFGGEDLLVFEDEDDGLMIYDEDGDHVEYCTDDDSSLSCSEFELFACDDA